MIGLCCSLWWLKHPRSSSLDLSNDVYRFQTLGLTVAALATLSVSQGGARHLYQIAPSKIMTVLKLSWLLQPFAIMALATAKISVAFVMLRIIPSTTVWARRSLYFAIVSTFVICAIASILTFVQCDPPRVLWEFGVKRAKCWDPRVQSDYAIFSACWNSFIDIGLALLPIPIISKLQMRLKKKLRIFGLLGLGVLAGISSTIKASKLFALRHRSDLTCEFPLPHAKAQSDEFDNMLIT